MANPIAEVLAPFVWGAGGAKKTPAEIARDKEIAAELLMKAGNTSPVQHWSQGAARVVDALGGVIKQRRAEAAGAENATYNEGIISSLLSGKAPAETSSIPPSGASAEMAATSPAQPIDMNGNEVFSQFIDTVKQGGVQNPYALAAIAATGKAESGFAPGNVNRTWSDPSQSGQAGTAGGIMSWRGPRYEALAATGDLSPSGQAKFFLQENPQLIEALNNAGSVEEAQSLMNNAWKFAGYDQPGGEAANRLAAAQGFLPSFQGGGEVAALQPQTATDAIAAVSPVEGGNLADEAAAFRQTPEYAAQFPGQDIGVQQPVQSQAVQQVAQALPAAGQQQQAVPGMNEALIRAISDPRATEQTKAIAQALMQQQMAQQQAAQEMRMKQADPAYQLGLEKSRLEVDNLRNPRLTPGDQLAREKFDLERGQQGKTADINEYEYAKERGYEGSFVDFQLAQKKASANNQVINTGEGDEFYKTLDKASGTSIAALSDAGMQANGKLAQIDRLEGLMANSPQGALGALKQAAGEFGIATDGLSDIQAASALLEKMVPEQRAPGSGPMSDADIKMFRASLPRIINQPGGNQLIFQTMRGIAQYEQQMGVLANKVLDRELKEDGTPYKAADFRRDVANLKNPLSNFKIPQGQTANEGVPAGVDAEDWKFMTPEERKLFQ